jgi:hypothetical protein
MGSKTSNSLLSYIKNFFFTKKYKFRSTVKDYLLTNSYYPLKEYFNSNSIRSWSHFFHPLFFSLLCVS